MNIYTRLYCILKYLYLTIYIFIIGFQAKFFFPWNKDHQAQYILSFKHYRDELAIITLSIIIVIIIHDQHHIQYNWYTSWVVFQLYTDTLPGLESWVFLLRVIDSEQ